MRPTLRVILASLALVSSAAHAQIDPRLYAGLEWRNLGPFRAGRVAAVAGAIGQAGTFYIGLPAAGVWKTTSAGETWTPIFDGVKEVASIGALDVSATNPNVIYVGTGDMITGGAINEGNGVWKSTDAGATWTHVGLDATKQIPSLLIDPGNPDVVLVAAQGDIHVKSGDRGVFRTTDGGRTWQRTLFADDETGVQKLARAWDVPNVVFATTVRHFQPIANPNGPPLRPAGADTGRTGTAIYKSTDGGVTWKEVVPNGLPRLTGRTSIAVAANTNAQRVYFVSNTGLFRSDDGGTTWKQMDAEDERVRNGQGGYNCGVYVDPRNPDVVYVINTAMYRSTDGGKSFTGFKGAPGGDDPQQFWIDPTDGKRMLLGLDQGATVSLDGGGSWSSWYNQSTEQVYHISVDVASWPNWVYATQQDAGAIRTRTRGNLGAVTPLDWNPVPGWEWGTIVPDPLHPDTVYSSGSGVVKIAYPTEQWINVSPALDPALKARTTSSSPIVFAPWNKHLLLAALQYVMGSTDGGVHWTRMSPDLTVPNGADTSVAGNRGAIESISPSSLGTGVIWVGTNNGLVQVTRDAGKTWSDVTIPNLANPRRAFVTSIEASRHTPGEAYVAIDYHTTGDYAPYAFRTRDWGKTWTKITTGLPVGQTSGSFVRVVREDPKRAGLLYAGTESGMFVSFDDGDHWQTLQQNLPNTSYRDIAFAGNNVVVGTYGRGIWVLDDASALRQITSAVASAPAHLFKSGDAIRVRRNVNADTPFPPEVPHALNPIEGAAIDYWLAAAPNGELTIDILDASNRLVRHLSSTVPAAVSEATHPPEPNFWLATPEGLPRAAGLNRAHWDLRYDAPPAFAHSFEINANPGLTPASPEGPLAPPGTYTVRLTVGGQSYTQPLVVRNDPRSAVSSAALAAQHALMQKLVSGLQATWTAAQQAAALRTALQASQSPSAAAALAKLDSLTGASRQRGGFRGGRPSAPTFASVNGALVQLLEAQDYADMAPTPAMLAGWTSACKDVATLDAAWRALVTTDVPKIGGLQAPALGAKWSGCN